MSLCRTNLLGIATSIVALALILWHADRVDFAALGRTLASADLVWLSLALGMFTVSFIPRVTRWRRLLRPIARVSVGATAEITLIGWMANNVLPARIGELVRAGLMARRTGARAASVFATVVVERILDGLTLVMILGVTLPFRAWPSWATTLGAFAAMLFVGALALIAGLRRWRGAVSGLGRRVAERLPAKIGRLGREMGGAFVSGLDILAETRAYGALALESLLVWGVEVIFIQWALLAFGFELPLYGAAFVLAVLNLGLIFPSAPGFVGTFHLFTVLSLAPFGIEGSEALGFAIGFHAVQYFPVTILGLILLARIGLSVRALGEAAREGVPVKGA